MIWRYRSKKILFSTTIRLCAVLSMNFTLMYPNTITSTNYPIQKFHFFIPVIISYKHPPLMLKRCYRFFTAATTSTSSFL